MNAFNTVEEVMEAQERYLHEQNFYQWHKSSEKLREYRKAQLIENFPWVFWISIQIASFSRRGKRKKRGTNYLEYRFKFLMITIGRPWLKNTLQRELKDRGDLSRVRRCNRDNLRDYRTAFMVGKYKIIG